MRVLAFDPTASVQLYLVGTSIVRVIASWILNVLPYSLSIIEAPTTFIFCSSLLSFLAHSKHGIFSFFGDFHGGLDLELVPKLFNFSTVRRVFDFVVLLPPSTAVVACPRFVHTAEPWRFRIMSKFSIVSFSSGHKCYHATM